MRYTFVLNYNKLLVLVLTCSCTMVLYPGQKNSKNKSNVESARQRREYDAIRERQLSREYDAFIRDQQRHEYDTFKKDHQRRERENNDAIERDRQRHEYEKNDISSKANSRVRNPQIIDRSVQTFGSRTETSSDSTPTSSSSSNNNDNPYNNTASAMTTPLATLASGNSDPAVTALAAVSFASGDGGGFGF